MGKVCAEWAWWWEQRGPRTGGGMRGRGEAEKVDGPGLGFGGGQGVEGNQRDREGW